jgi:hypothetical protein
LHWSAVSSVQQGLHSANGHALIFRTHWGDEALNGFWAVARARSRISKATFERPPWFRLCPAQVHSESYDGISAGSQGDGAMLIVICIYTVRIIWNPLFE